MRKRLLAPDMGSSLLCIEVWGSQYPPSSGERQEGDQRVVLYSHTLKPNSSEDAGSWIWILSPGALGLHTWWHCPCLLCPCPNTQSLWPANSCLIQNNLAIVYPQQHLQRHDMDFSVESLPCCRRGLSTPHPKPGAGQGGPVVAARMLQQLQLSGMSLQPWVLLDPVEGELLHSPDPTEHQGQGQC